MNDKVFSIHRLGLLWRFYTPAIRLQLAISGITLLVSYLICLAGATGALTAKITENGGRVAIYSFGAMIASYVFFSGPPVFAYCGQRRVVTTLPASWQEKAVFMLGYVFMLVPLFLAAIWYGSMGVMSFFTPAADVNATISHILLSKTHGLSFDSIMSGSKFGSTVAETATAAFSCFVIVAARRNRLALGIVAVFGARLLNWLAGVIVGIYAVLSSGIVSRVAKGDTDIAPQDLIGFIADAMPYYTALSALLTLVFAALAVSKNQKPPELMEFKTDRPIYRQIIDYAFGCILGGGWTPGAKVPSVRELAVELAVNSHTILKAYDHLQDNGIIVPRRGKGFFLAEDARERVDVERRREFFDSELHEVFARMDMLGIGIDEIVEAYKTRH